MHEDACCPLGLRDDGRLSLRRCFLGDVEVASGDQAESEEDADTPEH
jgi:hypothetical protein